MFPPSCYQVLEVSTSNSIDTQNILARCPCALDILSLKDFLVPRFRVTYQNGLLGNCTLVKPLDERLGNATEKYRVVTPANYRAIFDKIELKDPCIHEAVRRDFAASALRVLT
ncbi:hypothetical protein TWF225_007745 [Orbilia oligospora]|uniref:Uncharacterized protein n=1 Tax=Orbilia oligospora TaxID=2813651 RepID=A0A7C8PI45_ORBOL|nr:hypothetical protein TWF751_001297 [Orbilia oligospora]KAF3178712.1 hypothetical protein TWF225_007745 [Orbilia oligospora]KAF3242130.1 hypothetical protein TWF128_010604 [Orbilia oligospora]KAF3251673.1 hypothetical protein TWF217_008001 [Orbilia oligospora]KAF3296491.1 hypothetical protein TWF132_010089 [Orbilia oligospora]